MQAPDPDPPRDDRRALGLLAAALAVGLALRLHGLGALSFYYDELYAVRIHGLSVRNVAGVLARTAFYDIHPPLYYLATLVWTSAAGLSEAAVRGLSALAGVATLPVVYLLGRELHSRRVGALAALLLAALPVHVYYSREARMYTLMALCAATSTWLLVRLLRGDRARWILPAWLAATVATSLTHYFGVIHVVAEFAVVLLRGRRGVASAGSWLALFGVPGAVFVPFALFAQYQTKHNEVSYLGSGLEAYAQVAAWLGGAHQSLPAALAWTLPFTALVVVGARAAWREQGPAWSRPFAPAPAPDGLERAAAVALSVVSFAAAAWVFSHRNRYADRVTDLSMGRGEVEALAVLQGRTAVVGAFLGAAVGGAVAAYAATRDRVRVALTRWFPSPEEGFDPAGSLARVCLAVVLVPLAVSAVAGLAGRPLVLVRNFLCAAPFLALLAARGAVALAPPLRAAALVGFACVSLVVASRIGAAPPRADDPVAVRPWLLHTYFDWRRLEGIVGADREVPLVTLQHYATDAAVHYRNHHPVARVRANAEGALVVAQVRTDDGWRCEFEPGTRFHPELASRYYLLDLGARLAHERGLSRRLLDASRATHECSVAGTIPGGITVYQCVSSRGFALATAR